KIRGCGARGLDAAPSDRCDACARGEERLLHQTSAPEEFRYRAIFEIVNHDEIGTPAWRHKAAIHETENARCGNAGGAVRGERRRAEADRRADQKIEMTFFGNIERISIICTKGDIGRMTFGDQRGQSVKILGDGALAD